MAFADLFYESSSNYPSCSSSSLKRFSLFEEEEDNHHDDYDYNDHDQTKIFYDIQPKSSDSKHFQNLFQTLENLRSFSSSSSSSIEVQDSYKLFFQQLNESRNQNLAKYEKEKEIEIEEEKEQIQHEEEDEEEKEIVNTKKTKPSTTSKRSQPSSTISENEPKRRRQTSKKTKLQKEESNIEEKTQAPIESISSQDSF